MKGECIPKKGTRRISRIWYGKILQSKEEEQPGRDQLQPRSWLYQKVSINQKHQPKRSINLENLSKKKLKHIDFFLQNEASWRTFAEKNLQAIETQNWDKTFTDYIELKWQYF